MIRIPYQKEGIAIPAILMVGTMKSTQVSCLIAEMVPKGMAMNIEVIVAMIAICRESSNRRPIS